NIWSVCKYTRFCYLPVGPFVTRYLLVRSGSSSHCRLPVSAPVATSLHVRGGRNLAHRRPGRCSGHRNDTLVPLPTRTREIAHVFSNLQHAHEPDLSGCCLIDYWNFGRVLWYRRKVHRRSRTRPAQ